MQPSLNLSFESLSTYWTAPESPTTPPLSRFTTAGPSFYTKDNRGTAINVAGNYFSGPEGRTVTYPPDHANYAPTEAMTQHFVGRDDELLEIHRAFSRSHEGNLTTRPSKDSNRPARLAIYGEAAIGKSQLALRYAEMTYAEREYTHVFYMSATSADDIRSGMERILRLVKPSDYVCPQSIETQEALRWLEDADPTIAWLIVIDHVALESVDLLQTHLPRRNTRGDLLFTTQSQRVAEALADKSVLKLGSLTRDNAIKLLLQKAGVEASAEVVQEATVIVERLDHLPVPIRQAGSYTKFLGGSLDSVNRLLQEDDLAPLSRWDTRLTGYEHSTFESVILKQCVKAARSHPHAGDLLKVLSFMPSRGVELSVISAGALSLLKGPQKKFLRSPPDPLHPLRALLTDRSSPLRLFIKFAASDVEILNAVRHLQQFWLMRLEKFPIGGSNPSLKDNLVHVLQVPALVQAILQGVPSHTGDDNAHFDMAVFIMVTACKDHPSFHSCFWGSRSAFSHLQTLNEQERQPSIDGSRALKHGMDCMLSTSAGYDMTLPCSVQKVMDETVRLKDISDVQPANVQGTPEITWWLLPDKLPLVKVSDEELSLLKKLWNDFANLKTGQLERNRFTPFLAKSRDSNPFEFRIYPEEYGINTILKACRQSSELGVNLQKLNQFLDTVNYSAIRQRKALYTQLYYEMVMASKPNNGPSFGKTLLIMAHQKLIVKRDALKTSCKDNDGKPNKEYGQPGALSILGGNGVSSPTIPASDATTQATGNALLFFYHLTPVVVSGTSVIGSIEILDDEVAQRTLVRRGAANGLDDWKCPI
ncbi:hypothetical protein HWV62_44812 [Athelia sp. TMB]|nr:hypothetical protein HWV62_44812 [Athelia sp. TMB]